MYCTVCAKIKLRCIQAFEFGVNDRFGYTEVTKSLGDVNEKKVTQNFPGLKNWPNQSFRLRNVTKE